MSGPATNAELEALVAQTRRRAPRLASTFASSLSGKTIEEAKSALFGEIVGKGALAASASMERQLGRSEGETPPKQSSGGVGLAAASMAREMATMGIGDGQTRTGGAPSATDIMRAQLRRGGQQPDEAGG